MRVLLSIALTVALCWIVVRSLELIAPLHRAWTPSDFASVGGRADTWALASVRDDPRWCRNVLKASRVQFTPVPDRVTGPGCGFEGAVRLNGPELSPRAPVLTCPLAVALTLWERRVVRPAARRARQRYRGARTLWHLQLPGDRRQRPPQPACHRKRDRYRRVQAEARRRGVGAARLER